MSERTTFNQVNQQESSAYMNGSRDLPTVLIKRTNGNITVGRLNKHTKDVYFSEDGVRYQKQIALENLSDARQEELAIELAGRALRGAVEVETDAEKQTVQVEFDENGLIKMPTWSHPAEQGNPQDDASAIEHAPVKDPLDELDDSVRSEVLLYRRTIQNKIDSERAKNFAQAAEDGRIIYRFRQTLSPAAKAFLNLE